MKNDAATIMIVDDEAAQRELLGGFVRSRGFRTVDAASAEDALATLRTAVPQMILLDVRLPGMSGVEALPKIRELAANVPVLLITAYADLRQAVDAMKHGADDYLAKPIDLDELAAAIDDALGQARRGSTAAVELPGPVPDHLVRESPAMQRLVQTIAVVAVSDVPVFISGESGTGKEVIAQLIHEWSHRASGPLVTANCGGLPESLIESELFGHVKGAFTGATNPRQGMFRSAEHGTLFLDEIGELPLHLQPKLLRALEARQVTPVGSDAAVDVDVRLIAATNRDTTLAVENGEFRGDLYYRLNVIELQVPPLRERREDLLPLAKRFASEFSGGPVRLSPQATHCLMMYDWPGNVRQLRNAMQRASLLCRGDVILPEHLPSSIPAAVGTPSSSPPDQGRLSQVERATILATLDECQGNRTRAAEKLGISRRALIYKLRAIEERGS